MRPLDATDVSLLVVALMLGLLAYTAWVITGPLLYGLLVQAAKGLRWVWGGEWA